MLYPVAFLAAVAELSRAQSQNTDNIFIPVNIASGAAVTASSTSSTGACYPNRCDPINVIGYATNATGQWVSQPGSCDQSRSETLSLDWSSNFGVQYVTEVRYQFGILSAANTNLVVYDTQPMNINNPTAVTYINNDQWIVYVFEVPVTATSLTFTWSGFSSPDGNVSCAVAVRDVQVWTGQTPDSVNGDTNYSPGLSVGAIIGIVVGVVLLVTLAALFVFVRCQRHKNLLARTQRAFELRAYGVHRLYDDDDAARHLRQEPETGFAALSKKIHNIRTRNFLASVDPASASATATHMDATAAQAAEAPTVPTAAV
ncbi:hypothetical protein BC830DRAFT_1162635 [Chytriomyces sp. MP71]|nr:hypothetical protein BC830DRAFT_1162635 [Chytriomyces sp. MP71]